MAAKKKFTAELEALSTVLNALSDLDDSDQTWVLQTAASRLGLLVGASPSEPEALPGTAGSATSHTATKDDPDKSGPRQFLRAKGPKNNVQRVACLAYYLTHFRGQPHFKTRDLRALNVEAGGPRIDMLNAVSNATSQNHYFAVVGRGKKQITMLGQNVVTVLPDREAAKAAEKRGRPRRSRKKVASRKKTRT